MTKGPDWAKTCQTAIKVHSYNVLSTNAALLKNALPYLKISTASDAGQTKTWLNVCVSASEVVLRLRSDCLWNRAGGGVAIDMKDFQNFSPLTLSPRPTWISRPFFGTHSESNLGLLHLCPSDFASCSKTILLRQIQNLQDEYFRVLLLSVFNTSLKFFWD